MWMDHRKNDETHIDNHLPSSQTSAKMHHAGSISIWTLAHRSLHPHLEVWYLEIELKIPISFNGESLPRINDNPLYILFVSNSRNVLDGWAVSAFCCISWDLNFTSHWVPKDWGSIWFAWVWCFNIHIGISTTLWIFSGILWKSHSFIQRIHHCQGFKDLIIPYMSDGSQFWKGLTSASHGVRT